MDFIQRYARPFVLVLLAIAFVSALTIAGRTTDTADTDTTNQEEQTTEATDEAEPVAEDRTFENGVELTGTDYTLTAVSGDNQTVMVREIVGSYMSLRDDSLNPEQELYVETNLVDTLPRDDLIFVGDTIRLSDSTIEEVVNQAFALSAEQQAAWAVYL